jgi:WhiB family redox-sensing transcriptional regulator
MTNYEWELQANCFGKDTELFYCDDRDKIAQTMAKLICEACPVRGICLQFALDNKEEHGIWGGLTAKERKAKAIQLASKAIAS